MTRRMGALLAGAAWCVTACGADGSADVMPTPAPMEDRRVAAQVCFPDDGPQCYAPPLEARCLDFGLTALGFEHRRSIRLTDGGSLPLRVGEARVEDAEGAFAIDSRPESRDIVVSFAPRRRGAYEATVFVATNDPEHPELEVCVRAEVDDPPIVRCDSTPSVVAPLTRVSLDCSRSFDPDSEQPLRFEWRFQEDAEGGGRPQGSTTTLETDGPQAHFFADLAGTYHVELVLRDAAGLRNVRRILHKIRAEPQSELFVALAWDDPDAELDLHFHPVGSALFGPDDCYEAQCAPDDNPGLVRHGSSETLRFDAPPAEVFAISVHYRSHAERSRSLANATVQVYCGGVLRGRFFMPFVIDQQLWEVAEVDCPRCTIREVGMLSSGVRDPASR